MILVYVCPGCKAVRIASRRKNVPCVECDGQMILSDLTFMEWTEMTPSQRKTYGPIWFRREEERLRKWKEKQKTMERNKKEKQNRLNE